MTNSITTFIENLKDKYVTKFQTTSSELNKNPELGVRKEVINSTENQEVEYEIVEKEILPEKMICPDCGGITLVGLEFCDKCGGELINPDLL